jgi:hypothetical protein
LALARRQASEQTATSAQFFAQLRRQLMGRPQARQGLLGSPALLPRNVARGGITTRAGGRPAWSHLAGTDLAPAQARKSQRR